MVTIRRKVYDVLDMMHERAMAQVGAGTGLDANGLILSPGAKFNANSAAESGKNTKLPSFGANLFVAIFIC